MFWNIAKETEFFDTLKKELESYTDEQRENDQKGTGMMGVITEKIMKSNNKFVDIKEEI